MLIILVISVALRWTLVSGVLEGCPIDESHTVDDKVMTNVLRDFYNNLNFVKASTRSKELRDYKDVSDEIKIVFSPTERPKVDDLVEVLKQERYLEAYTNLRVVFSNSKHLPAARSYRDYFETETVRLLGFDASPNVQTALKLRQGTKGLSINELERQDGMVTLQRVSRYNRQVDMLFGLGRSPDYETLSLNSNNMTLTLDLLKESTIERIDPDQDDLTGQSVARSSAEGIICEFAQKIVILDAHEPRETHHRSLVAQMSALDPKFSLEFHKNVISNIEEGKLDEALTAVVDFWSQFEPTLAMDEERGAVMRHGRLMDHARTMETFAKYFRAEIMYIQSLDDCRYLQQTELLIESLKQTRSMRTGVSLSTILTLEGRLVFLVLRCFNQRIQKLYRLEGNEERKDLALKRARHGSCRAYVPPMELMMRPL